MTGICAMLVLDPSLAEEIKNDERLSFARNVKQVQSFEATDVKSEPESH